MILIPAQDSSHAHDTTQASKKKLEAALTAAVLGLIPPGFTQDTLETTPGAQVSGDVHKTLVSRYHNMAYRLEVYTLEHQGSREIFLSPSLFLGPHDLAVVFDQTSLKAGDTVRMAILKKHRGMPSKVPPSLKSRTQPTSTYKGQ